MILDITVLGPFDAKGPDGPLTLSSRRSRAIMAMLVAANDMSLSRAELCSRLWGSRSDEQARASLRQELASLRRRLQDAGADVLQADKERVGLSQGSVVADIAVLFAQNTDPADALAVGQGPLLDGFELNEPAFEEWLAETRRSVEERSIELGRRLAASALSRDDWSLLLSAASSILQHSPYDEEAMRWRMQALAACGRRADALAACDRFEALLETELKMQPEPETLALRNSIRAGAEPSVPEKDAPVRGQADAFSRPAVLFLPFEALSRSEEDALLALGLCEDIRTTLACWRWFPVIGPEALRGRTGDVQSLAANVNASYVVTGSVRRNGERARVTARLIDGAAGQELWSQSFDGELRDVFEFQDDISRRIVSQIEPEIVQAAAARVPVARPRELATWELLAHVADAERKGGDGYGTREANEVQRDLLLAILEREPDLADAWARLARCHFREYLLGWGEDGEAALREALDASSHAVELSPGNSFVRSCHAQCVLFGRHDPVSALEHAQEAVRLNPSNVMGQIMMGCVLVYYGDADRAYAHYEMALRLNPNFSNMGVVYCDQMMCRAMVGAVDEAVVLARKMMSAAPKYYRGLQRCAAILAQAGELEEARSILQKTQEIGGAFDEAYIRETYPFVATEHLEYLISGLRKAGWNG